MAWLLAQEQSVAPVPVGVAVPGVLRSAECLDLLCSVAGSARCRASPWSQLNFQYYLSKYVPLRRCDHLVINATEQPLCCHIRPRAMHDTHLYDGSRPCRAAACCCTTTAHTHLTLSVLLLFMLLTLAMHLPRPCAALPPIGQPRVVAHHNAAHPHLGNRQSVMLAVLTLLVHLRAATSTPLQGSRVLWHHNAAVTGLALEDPWLASSAADGCIILQVGGGAAGSKCIPA